MRWLLVFAILPCLLSGLCVPAAAVSVEEALQRQEESLEIEELEGAAKDAGSDVEYGVSLEEGLNGLLEQGTEAAGGIVRSALKSGVLLMAVILLCGFGESVYGTVGKGTLPVIPIVGALAVAAIAVADVAVTNIRILQFKKPIWTDFSLFLLSVI